MERFVLDIRLHVPDRARVVDAAERRRPTAPNRRGGARRLAAIAVAVAAMFGALVATAANGQDTAGSEATVAEAVTTSATEAEGAASAEPAATVDPEPAEPTVAPSPEETSEPDPASETPPPSETPPASETPPPSETPPASETPTNDGPPATEATQTSDASSPGAATPTPAAAPADRSGRHRGRPNTRSGEGCHSGRECSGRGDGSHAPRSMPAPRLANPDGSPAVSNPTFSLAIPGPVRVGVPNFFIDKFRIPPFLLPIYQAAGIQYGVRWELLAAINEIESDYGRNLNVSSAGAVGWMQFMPSTWAAYGVDANGDGAKDPYNPVDAIFAAARYLKAAGADQDIRRAVFAYNHADWYVDSVLLRAQFIGGLPADLVSSLTGLTQGRFPVLARATYAQQLTENGNRVKHGNAAMLVQSDTARRGIEIFSRPNAPVIAVNDGRIVGIGHDRLTLQDMYGNTYTYGHLGEIARPGEFRKGARVVGGTILGRLGAERAPHLRFEIRPAGHGAPRIDPKPILDGWKLLESTAIYRAKGKNPFFGADAENPTIGQIMLMSKEMLVRRVLADRRIDVYDCGQGDIRSGQIDRRVLATMLYLASSGLKPTVTSLKCGHSHLTASGNVSEHSTGTAIDIAAVNGVVITPQTQGPGSIAELTIRRLLTLQGVMKPHQIISLMTFAGADNTYSMGDHDDHIHVGWRPLYGENRRAARQIDAVLEPEQWIKLIDRLEEIDNPTIREQPAVRTRGRASRAHRGE